MIIKSCPFCGQLNNIAIENVLDEGYFVICWRCHATGPKEVVKSEAVHGWNMRKPVVWRPIRMEDND